VSDDWRIRIDLEEEHAEGLLERLGLDLGSEPRKLAEELQGRRLVVSRDDDTLFVYAGSRVEAERARDIIEAELRETGAQGQVGPIERWLADEDRWDDEAPQEFEAEQEVLKEGLSPWEVRLEANSPEEAETVAAKLAADGYSVVRRYRFVLVGANSEEEARELAKRLHGEAEASGELVYETLPQNPFVIFGGLGGSGTPL
jgi:HPt (histidine-containing phosphotransfer) domain-containing protein